MNVGLVQEYIQRSGASYQQWCDEEADRFISTQTYLQLCFLLISINNLLKGGAFWWLLPPMLVLFLGYVRLKLKVIAFRSTSVWLWDVFCALGLIASVQMHDAILRLNLPQYNAPILVATLCTAMTNLRSTRHALFIRNGILASVIFFASAVILKENSAHITIQIVEGVFAGTFVAVFFLHSKQLRFYHVRTNIENCVYAYAELSKIVPPHVVKCIESGKHLEDSMPIGFANACVISLDIIASSKVQHTEFSAAVERFTGRCYMKMMENYDEDSIVANAYRIKDLGDGFLCSVGFPYGLPPGKSTADLAVDLGVCFARYFEEEMALLQHSQHLRCAIGVAQGRVEGFFPSFGVKQYDLRGRPLMLAKRYESLRNQFVKMGWEESSFLLIQEKVYQNLSLESQKNFGRYDTEFLETSIRDDSSAKAVYARFLPCAIATMSEQHSSLQKIS